MMKCFDDGLVFLKSIERGKCFIEYIPDENAWVPINAENYMYIDCFWVLGSFKGHGYSNDLLNKCIEDSKAKGKSGLCILSSVKKKPFLSDPKHLIYKGFQVADTSEVGINLMYLPFDTVIVLILLVVITCFSSCSIMLSGVTNATVESSYSAKEQIILQVNEHDCILFNCPTHLFRFF